MPGASVPKSNSRIGNGFIPKHTSMRSSTRIPLDDRLHGLHFHVPSLPSPAEAQSAVVRPPPLQ